MDEITTLGQLGDWVRANGVTVKVRHQPGQLPWVCQVCDQVKADGLSIESAVNAAMRGHAALIVLNGGES